MRLPGFEPGSPPWQGGILPLDYNRTYINMKNVFKFICGFCQYTFLKFSTFMFMVFDMKKALVLSENEEFSKALNYLLKEGIPVVITSKGKYVGIVDDRNISLKNLDPSKIKLKNIYVKAPKIYDYEMSDDEVLIKKFLSGHFKGLPVVNKRDEVIGIYTRADLLNKLLKEKKIPKVSINAIMSVPIYTVDYKETIGTVKKIMKELKAHRLVVVNKNKMVGVISTWDFVMLVKDKKTKGSRQLIKEIKRLDDLEIKQFIRDPLLTIFYDELLTYAVREMADKDVSYAVIIDSKRVPIGILSALDVFKLVLKLNSEKKQVFIIGLGWEDVYYYEMAKDLLEKLIKKYERMLNIDHIYVRVKKGKRLYTANLTCDVENIPIYITSTGHNVEELFDNIYKNLSKVLRKMKDKLKEGLSKANLEVMEEEEYI